MPKSFLESAAEIINGNLTEEVVKQPPQKLDGEIRDMGSEGPPGETAGKKASADAKKVAAPKGPSSEGGPEGGRLPGEIDVVNAKEKNLGEEVDEDEEVIVEVEDDADLDDGEVVEEDYEVESDEEDESDEDEALEDEGEELTEEEALAAKQAALAEIVDEHMGSVQEDVDALFQGEELSEDFKKKAKAIFEGAVRARVLLVTEEVSDALEEVLVEEVDGISTELAEQLDSYLGYVVEEWTKDNEIAIESGLRTEITEEFLAGLKTLFKEHHIEIPEDKVNIVEELAESNEKTAEQLNAVLNENIELKKKVANFQKESILKSVCEGLTVSQTEKMKSLTEGVNFTTEGEYKENLTVIRENYFPTKSDTVKSDVVATPENTEAAPIVESKTVDPSIASFAETISRTSALRRL